MSRVYVWPTMATFFASCAVACAHASDPMTFQDHFFVGSEGADGIQCVEQYGDAGRAAVDACRAHVHEHWDDYWRHHDFGDGGTQ